MAAVVLGCEQRMGEGEGVGMEIYTSGGGRNTEGEQAGLAAFLLWATVVGFPCHAALTAARERKVPVEKKGNTGKKKGKKKRALTGGARAQ